MIRLLILLLVILPLPVFSADATFYSDIFEGRRMANGQRYSHKNLTAAHMTLPLGTIVRVTYQRNGRSVRVKITDRGGFNPRNIDLSRRAFGILAKHSSGRIPVKIEVIHGKK